jgi:uncharacterized protein
MRCPVDGETLVMSERAGIEIDYCQHCRGVWLDRGELDKIIERSTRDSRGDHRQLTRHEEDRHPLPGTARQSSGDYGQSQPRRRRSFLEDLLD